MPAKIPTTDHTGGIQTIEKRYCDTALKVAYVSPIAMTPPKAPVIPPSIRRGRLIKLSSAHTICMALISSIRAKTVIRDVMPMIRVAAKANAEPSIMIVTTPMRLIVKSFCTHS